MKEILALRNVSYSYDGDKKAVDSFSLSIQEGEYVTIIGHNGSGKSTIAKIIMGIVDKIDGELSLFGEVVNRKNSGSLRAKLGIVFQNPDNQFVGATVADDIAFGLENHRIPHEDMEGIIHKFASKVGMIEYLDREPESLSGGQKQRVAIAGVLAMQPDIVIFDEATAMLDPKGRKEIASLISMMKEEKPNLTIISITHDVEEANHSDRVIVMNKGQLVLEGKPEEVFIHDKELNEINLQSPFFYRLVRSLKDNGLEVPSTIKNMNELEEFLCR